MEGAMVFDKDIKRYLLFLLALLILSFLGSKWEGRHASVSADDDDRTRPIATIRRA